MNTPITEPGQPAAPRSFFRSSPGLLSKLKNVLFFAESADGNQG